MRDKLLIERLRNSDKKSLTQLYNIYWDSLYISAYNLLKDRELCEEVVQDVFIELWNNREKLVIKVSLRSYLYACTRYKVFAQFSKRKALEPEPSEELSKRVHYGTPETRIIYEELVEQVNSIVDTLPNRCKTVYILSRDEQLSHKEIAEKLNISTKTVENHITKALKVLRESLGYIYIYIY